MTNRLRIGLIGTSGYTERVYLPVLLAHEEADLAAICGRTHSRAQELSSKYQVPEVYTDYQEMIRRGKLDALIISTPDDLHYPMTMAALDAGLNVLCEKPMALNAQEAGEMLDAAERAGVKHMIEFTWRWFPHYQYLRQLIADGYVGSGYHYHFRFLGNRGRINDYTWRFDPARSIGVLGDLGSHMLDLALWLCGDIKSVSSNLNSFSERTGPDGRTFMGANESALLALDFADGAQGMIHVSTVAHTADRGREQTVFLHGEAGTLEVDWKIFGGADPLVVMRGSRHDEEQFHNLDVPASFLNGVNLGDLVPVFEKHLVGPRLFVDAILNDYMPEPNFRQGLKVQQVLDAAVKSHNTGCRLAVES